MPHRDTRLAIKHAITQALNATQGHKRSYQASYFSGSKCHTGTQAFAIVQALNRSLPYTARYDLNQNISTGVKLVLILTDLFTNIYMLHVKYSKYYAGLYIIALM